MPNGAQTDQDALAAQFGGTRSTAAPPAAPPGTDPHAMARQYGATITPAGEALADQGALPQIEQTLKSVVKFPFEAAKSLVSAEPETPEEAGVMIPGMGELGRHIALTAKRYILDPSEREFELARAEKPKPTDVWWENAEERRHMHEIAAMVPVVGPMAGAVVSRALAGDFSGAMGQLGTLVATGAITDMAAGPIMRRLQRLEGLRTQREAPPAYEPPAPPNPSPEARARDARVDLEHSHLVIRRLDVENKIGQIDALMNSPRWAGRSARTQAGVLNRLAELQEQQADLTRNLDELTGAMHTSAFGLDMAYKAAQRFYELDIAPRLTAAKASFPTALAELQHAIMPRKGAAIETLDSVMKLLGEREKQAATRKLTVGVILRKSRDLFKSMSRTTQTDFVDRMKLGRPQAKPYLQELADFMRRVDDAKGTMARGSTYRELAEAQVAVMDESAQRAWAKLSETDKVQFLKRIGTFKASPELLEPGPLKDLVERILAYKQDHYQVIWKVKPPSDAEMEAAEETGVEPTPRELRTGAVVGRRPLRGPRGYRYRSTLDTMSEGITRGGVPLSFNPIEMFELAQAMRWREITALRMWKEAKDLGARVFVRRGQQAPEGFARLDDSMAQVRHLIVTDKGPREVGGEWYMREDYARMLNNYLSTDMIKRLALGRGLMWAKNNLTVWRLAVPFFHAVTETFQAAVTEAGLAKEQIWNTGIRNSDIASIGRGAKTYIKSPFGAITRYRAGTSAIKYLEDKNTFLKTLRGQSFAREFPEIDAMLDQFFWSGGKIALHEDEAPRAITGFTQALADGNPFGALPRAAFAANEYLFRPLFEYFIPRVKLGGFLRDYAQSLRDRAEDLDAGRVTRGQLGRRDWDMNENLMGQVNWDKFFWNRTLKTAAQFTFRALQWTSGFGRFVNDAIRGQAHEMLPMADWFNERMNPSAVRRTPVSAKIIPRLDPNFARLVSYAEAYVVVNELLGLMLTKKLTTDWRDTISIRTGRLDNQGKPERVMLGGLIKDALSLWFMGPFDYIKNRESDLLTGVADVIQNRDWANNLVRNPDDNYWKQIEQSAGHIIGLPMGASAFQRERQAGAGVEAEILGALGFTPAPRLNYTKAENAAYDLYRRRAPSRTPEEIGQIQEYMGRKAAGQLSGREAAQAAKAARKPLIVHYFERAVQEGATYDELKHVYDQARPEERVLLRKMIYDAYKREAKRGRQVAAP